MRFLSYGPFALLVEVEGGRAPAALAAAIEGAMPAGVEEVVPAAQTVLVRFDPGRARPSDLEAQIRDLAARATAVERPARRAVEIPVVYDGEDLEKVAVLTGLTVADVVERHRSGAYTVAFCGFAPGFAYLTGLDPMLVVPRRDTPRTAVPAGSVAVAGPYSAVYPSESPGGWQLIGRTDRRVWDVGAPQPALLTPGTSVRFVPVVADP